MPDACMHVCLHGRIFAEQVGGTRFLVRTINPEDLLLNTLALDVRILCYPPYRMFARMCLQESICWLSLIFATLLHSLQACICQCKFASLCLPVKSKFDICQFILSVDNALHGTFSTAQLKQLLRSIDELPVPRRATYRGLDANAAVKFLTVLALLTATTVILIIPQTPPHSCRGLATRRAGDRVSSPRDDEQRRRVDSIGRPNERTALHPHIWRPERGRPTAFPLHRARLAGYD